MALQEDIASTLTPEELEAIGAEDAQDEHRIMRAPEADEPDDDGEDDEPGAGADPDPAADTVVPSELEPPAALDPDPAPEPAPQSRAADPAVYRAALPGDYEAQLAAIRQQEAEANAKFKAGEMDFEERDAAVEALRDQREQLLVQRAKAEISQEMAQQTAAQQWNAAVNGFVADVAAEVDYRQDAAKAADLDAFLKTLAARQENVGRPMDWFLRQAHQRVKALHGVAAPVTAPPPSAAPPSRKPPLAAIPPNLSQVPGSDGPGDVGEEFGDVLALDGMEYEAALARMSPVQREKFLRG